MKCHSNLRVYKTRQSSFNNFVEALLLQIQLFSLKELHFCMLKAKHKDTKINEISAYYYRKLGKTLDIHCG